MVATGGSRGGVASWVVIMLWVKHADARTLLQQMIRGLMQMLTVGGHLTNRRRFTG